MPSFPSFLKSSRHSQQIDRTSVQFEQNGGTEKAPRSPSKRDFFRKLLKRSSSRHESTKDDPPKKAKSVANIESNEQPLQSPKQPPSPMSDPNKPLPPAPLPGAEDPPPAKAPVKLERIIAPLAIDDLHKLFSGAPQFFARSEGHGTGAPHPSVAYPYNTEVEVRDLSDHVKIQDEAWSYMSAWPHISLQVSQNPDSSKEYNEKQRARFLPKCRERPSMLSMQGLERGTMGFQAALEMGVADALQSSKEGSFSSPAHISEHRRAFLNRKDGLRPLTDSSLIDKLIDVSEMYHGDPVGQNTPTIELYTELFTQTLYPPSRVTDSDDPYSLQVQIEVLIEVLSAKYVWVDYSLVEWRIRLGQILWGTFSGHDADHADDIDDGFPDEPNTEKYWLLLQVLLSCELLLRLDIVSRGVESRHEDVSPEEIRRFEKSATTSVRWSMILARHWLDNIKIEKPSPEIIPEKKAATGWLSSLASHPTEHITVPKEALDDVRFEGRHQVRQLQGLVHFARKLNWPGLDTLISKVSLNGVAISESTGTTPFGTPRSTLTHRSSSYFSRRPNTRRGLSSASNRMSAIIHPSGWLSNSYLSGFILPGESISHFLISTLLENDELAVSKLGEEANLYGGFVYQGRSFWSTSCIVGRVLAAGQGAFECVGWISSDIIPRGTGEGWVEIDVEDVEDSDNDKKEKRPRIQRKATVERRGHVIGGADTSSILPGDFIYPSDDSIQNALSVTFESLDLFAAIDSTPSTPPKETPTHENLTPLTEISEPPKIKTCSAMMRFAVEADGEAMKEVNISLNNDVFFLTAHPCVPSKDVEVLKPPSSPTSTSAEAGHASVYSGHPLHKAFTYTTIPLNQLLTTPSSTSFSTLLTPTNSSQSSTHTTSSSIPKVLVIDCTDSNMNSNQTIEGTDIHGAENTHRARFGSDLEMLARAFCCERGWNALVSRRGRGCLACAVREAGSVGWRVVLRIA